VECLPGKGAAGVHGFAVVDVPVDASVDTAEPVFFGHVAQAGPVPGDAPQLRPDHLVGRAAGEGNVVAAVDQRDHLGGCGTESAVARGVGGEFGGRDVASPIGLKDDSWIRVVEFRGPHADRAFRAEHVVVVFCIPCADRGVALRHADQGEGTGELDEAEVPFLQQLHGDIEEMPRRRDAPRPVLPEQGDFRLVGGPQGAVFSPEAAGGVECLSKFRACRIIEFGTAELRAAFHGPRLDLTVSWKQAAVERGESRAWAGAVERSGGAPAKRVRASRSR